MKKAKFLMTLAIAAMAGVFTACENTPNTPVGPGTGGNEGGEGGETGEVLTVAKLLDMTVPDKNAGTDKYWVEGYIVGCYNYNNGNPVYQIGTEQAVNSSLLLADDPENTDTYKVISVKLTGTIFRDALNLVDNPGNYKKKLKIYGVVEKYCGINGVVNLEQGYLDDEEIKAPEVSQKTFTLVTDENITAGTYAIAANVNGTYKVFEALAESYNYGYAYTVDGTFSNNTLTANQTCALTFTETDGGFTITDCYNKFYYMSGSYNSFNVSTTNPGTSAVWTFTKNADGTYNITNTSNSKYIQYSTTYTSYGCYPDVQGVTPQLFKLTE